MTVSFDGPALPSEGSDTKRSSGCMKWGALLGSSFLIFMGFVTACGPDEAVSEVPAVTVTQTVTSTTTTTAKASKVKASTVTETVTETPSVEEYSEEVVEPAAVEQNVEPEVYAPQRFASIPDPAPAPAPAPVQSYYANCAAVRAAGAAPLYAGSPGYSSKLDRDGDGVACE